MVRNPWTYVATVCLCVLVVTMSVLPSSKGGEPSDEAREPEKEAVTPTAGDATGKPVTADEIKTLSTYNNAFAADLYGALRKKEPGNLFFSPYSIRTALAMTYAGAKGNTAAEMRTALHFQLPDARLHAANRAMAEQVQHGGDAGPTLRIANSLWGQKGYDFQPSFLQLIENSYKGGMHRVDFKNELEATRQTINRWVADRTEEKIRDLIRKGDLDRLTRLVLVNAIYFYGQWEHAFAKEMTEEAPFHLEPEKQVAVQLMTHKVGREKIDGEWKQYNRPEFRYLKTDDFQAVQLPYRGEALDMVVFLPNRKDGLAAMEEALLRRQRKTPTSGVALTYLQIYLRQIDRIPSRKVIVYLPRWSTTWGTRDITHTMQTLGMRQAFQVRQADFSGINGIKPPSRDALNISAILHKAFIDVNEEGTEAAAATAVVVRAGAAAGGPTIFRADHPFLYVIRDRRTGAILFMGRVSNPTDK